MGFHFNGRCKNIWILMRFAGIPAGTWRAVMFPSPWRGSASPHPTPRPLTRMTANRKEPAGCRCLKVSLITSGPATDGCLPLAVTSVEQSCGLLRRPSHSLNISLSDSAVPAPCQNLLFYALFGRTSLVEGSIWSHPFGSSRQKVQWRSHSGSGHFAAPTCS